MNLLLSRWLMLKHRHLAGHKTPAAEMLRRIADGDLLARRADRRRSASRSRSACTLRRRVSRRDRNPRAATISAKCNRAHLALGSIVGQADAPVLEEPGECSPALEHV